MIVDFHSHDFLDSLATRAMRGMCRMTEARLWPVQDGARFAKLLAELMMK